MGLSNNSGGTRTFLNIKEGKFALRAKDGSIETFSNVSGTLTSVVIKEGKFGKELHVGLTDGGDQFIIQMKLDSGYARGFMMAIKNAELNIPVSLSANYEEVDNKKKSSLFISQGGKALKWVWTKANPGDLPPIESVELDGKTIWSSRKQMAYLENMLLTEIVPRLTHPAVAASAPASEPQPKYLKEQTKLEDMPADDLPF